MGNGTLLAQRDAAQAVDAEFDRNYQLFARYVGESGTSLLSGSVYAEHPALADWVIGVRDAYNRGELPHDQQVRMEALRDWTWLVGGADWMNPYRDLEALLTGPNPPDLTDATVFAGDDAALAWARRQQLGWQRLTDAQVAALDRLPGWAWATVLDEKVDAARATLAYLRAFKSAPEVRDTIRDLLALPDASLAALLEDPSPVSMEQRLMLEQAVDPRLVSEAAAYEEVRAHLPENANHGMEAFIAAHLDLFVDGVLDVLALTALGHPDAAAVVATYRSYHTAQRGHAPHEQYVAGPQDVYLGDLPGVAAVWQPLHDAGIFWRGQLVQHTADEVRAVVGPTLLVTTLLVASADTLICPTASTDAGGARTEEPAGVGDVDLAGRHIAFLKLSVRTYNVLMREGLTRVGDVLAIEDPQQLLRLRGFGVACLDNLRDQLTAHGANPVF